MELVSYVLAMYTVGNVPASLSLSTWTAARKHAVDPVVLGSYLISEHRGDYPTDKCSPRDACGVFQLTALWPRHFGYPLEARFEPASAAEMAAQLMIYSQDVHEARGAPRDHDWRAHLKCAPGSRDRCHEPVERWLAVEADLRALLELDEDEPES